ncbi:MAG: FAD-dependent oxidoreductase [Myxococcota bacterium]
MLRYLVRLFYLFSVTSFAVNIPLECHVVVVGGGPGGLHTAYQLSRLPKSNPDSNVCLIEKEDHLGGRLLDAALDPKRPDLLYGLGALRVMETQSYVRSLAAALGIELQLAPYRDDLISTRGFFSFSSDEINQLAFPALTKSYINNTGHGTEDAFYDRLLNGPLRHQASLYPDLRSYVTAALGPQAYHFLPEVYRFRAEFDYPIDTRSYLDYMDEEMQTCCKPYYPVGGMSAFIRGMATVSRSNGAQIFLREPALTISKVNGSYEITTPHHQFLAQKLVLALDANSFRYLRGDIAERIKSKPQFQDIIGVKVATVSQKWPNAWWKNAGYPGKDIHRAWTTDHCLHFIEMPINPYAAQQNVTRSVYDDDMRCVAFWEQTYRNLGIKAVEAEVMKGLKYLFPKADIPAPLNTVVKIWPAAWYYLKIGTKFSNKDVAIWALNPLQGEDVSLVGDSYFINRSGWSDAAYKSSIGTLNARFGFQIPMP